MSSPLNRLPYSIQLLILSALVWGAARAGYVFIVTDTQVSAFWPLTGLGLAALLHGGLRLWPGLFIGAFAASLTMGATVAFALGSGVANAVGPALGSFLLLRFARFQPGLQRSRDWIAFLLFGAVLAPWVSATAGCGSLLLRGVVGHDEAVSLWTTWWLGDSMGALVVGPALLTWGAAWESRQSRRRLAEATVLALVLGVMTILLFLLPASVSHGRSVLSLVCFPPLIWAALRFSPRAAATGVLLICVTAAVGSVTERGVLAGRSFARNTTMVQTFMAVATVMTLLVATTQAERHTALEELRRSEERFRLANSGPHDALWDWADLDGENIWFSPRFYEMLGYESGEVILTKTFFARELLHPGDKNRVVEALSAHREGREPYDIEYRLRCRDGSYRWFRSRGAAVRDESGRGVRMAGSIHDVHERKGAEQAMRESEARFRTLCECSPVGIYLQSTEGNALYVNSRWCEIAGLPAEDALGKGWMSALHPEDRKTMLTNWTAHARSSGEFNKDIRFVHPSGEIRWVSVQSGQVIGADGKITAYVGTVADITAQKDAEKILREAEAKYRSFFEQSPEGAMIIDPDTGLIAEANAALHRILGFKVGELHGRAIAEICAQDTPGEIRRHIEAIRLSGEDSFETRLRAKPGDIRDVVFNVKAVEIAGQLRFHCVAQDITDRKRAAGEIRRLNEDLEERVRQRTAQLEAANKELEAFSYSVSHDLRAPLRHVSGFSSLLLQRQSVSDDETARRLLSNVVSAAQRMGNLVDDLLVFSRMGRTEIHRGWISFDALVQRVREELQADSAGRDIEWKIAPLPEAMGDPPMLRLVLVNLLSNALKYTRPRSRVEIEIGSQPGEGEIIYFVRDNGVGFDPLYADKLFGVFQRLHRDEEFEGTGIGLANVRRIISRHGGRTWAEGAPDGGATFFFSLPVASPRESSTGMEAAQNDSAQRTF